jgi:hypothetical protein
MHARVDASGGGIRWLPVFCGGLLIALGDMAFATTLWFQWNLAGIERVFQTIAVGVLGKASLDGGMPAALLGALLHLGMATTFVLVYTLASRRAPSLLQHPLLRGAAYGLLIYLVMNFVVMPLSRVGRSPSLAHPDWIAWSIAAHLVFGIVCALAAQRALGVRGTGLANPDRLSARATARR